MDGVLKVTPEKLIESSEEFGEAASSMHALSEEMINLVNSLSSIWQGEAQNAYSSKFNSLDTDMDKIYRMIEEHSKDLSEMASSYKEAETGNTESSNTLKTGVVV